MEKMESIMIVDDDEGSLFLLETILGIINQDFKIIKASNGFEAIEILKTQANINLILMDVRMPVMNGIQATRYIRNPDNKNKFRFLNDPPIIGVTSEKADFENECIKIGMNKLISKPINKEIIDSVLEEYF